MRGALIGCGFFARNHLAAWRDLGVDMVLCDRRRDRAEALAAAFGPFPIYEQAHAMIAAERLDFVDIATTVESHRPLVEMAAAAGLPMICQKPFALDMGDASAMVAAAKAAGVPLMVHENFRWQTPMLAVAEALAAGAVGTPSFARVSFRHGFDVYANQPYLATEPRLALVDVGVHVLDLARVFLGEATRIYCRTQRLNPRVTGEDAATILLDHAGGAVSIVDISFYAKRAPEPFPQTLVQVEGDRGTVVLGEDYRLTTVRDGRRDERSVDPEVPAWGERPWHVIQGSVFNLQRHWLDSLRAGTEPRPSGADNLKTLDLVFKAYESAASGRAIAVDAGRLARAMSERIEATYLLETADEPARAAEIIAGEQSSGTFVALAHETPELKARSGARVEALEVIGEVDGPSLPGALAGPVHRRCRMRLSWPLDNLGPSLPNLVATVAGNLFELKSVAALRLTGLSLPSAFAERHAGPRHGIAGTRELAGVAAGPLIGTIVKPSVGLSPDETAREVAALIEGGIDFVKDDELQADGPHCPFEARVKAVMRVVRDAAEKTGKKAMIAFNLTGDLDEMRRRHDLVLAEGGTCVMASLHSVGFVGILELARHSALPIHGHRNGWGYLSRHPALGWDYAPWQMLWRLAGVDHLHVNGIANKFCETDESVIASAKAVLAPMFEEKPMAAMPVFSSGQTARQAAPTFAAIGTTDLIFAAGGGIFGHPGGVSEGVAALREAWAAAVDGVPVERRARENPALAAALGVGR